MLLPLAGTFQRGVRSLKLTMVVDRGEVFRVATSPNISILEMARLDDNLSGEQPSK